jgi:hypothetical protein
MATAGDSGEKLARRPGLAAHDGGDVVCDFPVSGARGVKRWLHFPATLAKPAPHHEQKIDARSRRKSKAPCK